MRSRDVEIVMKTKEEVGMKIQQQGVVKGEKEIYYAYDMTKMTKNSGGACVPSLKLFLLSPGPYRLVLSESLS